ncbi:alpha-glucuronidase family glycosyl hydrolase [Clostridium estertheticum]|uniref:Xylan alpha-1,2-glucuronidase n=1 Tax=Clostridium estertheticum subsp. estertheticum TaxID=1552 RepID=A0A1J0GFP8_9CLOT|nr:alpha-glucuronidase family glycosyl hydrolase [Clostridium estertheticum]APC40149.1 alpha-glucuronidase [Clostridium estertheticum subsp. estertheticum]MBU3170371.1 alpha-glucuronidase [Clostridium estertheticum]MBZ9618065.1 alpha-glucuronidase [Clostridium estertheticum subsp. laramiense]WAG73721.1 alpha-glucuronidase [Clostridium estertheticum]
MEYINKESSSLYNCWLNYDKEVTLSDEIKEILKTIQLNEEGIIINTAVKELSRAIKKLIGKTPEIIKDTMLSHIYLGKLKDKTIKLVPGGFSIKKSTLNQKNIIEILGKDENGILNGVFSFIRAIYTGSNINEINIVDNPRNMVRMINHWDNMSGDIERGYAGESIFFKDNHIVENKSRIRDYARLMASVAINGIVINNVNVHKQETKLITDELLPEVKKIADIFRAYGIKLYLSVNFASPMEIGGFLTADPLDFNVRTWWKKTAENIYSYIPDFGGFLVKADSESRPGPFTYGRNHAEGANMLAEALRLFGGIVIWRCFVYNCKLDWRDRSTDRAKAAFDNFKPLDGKFDENVVLQVKNGPVDFQIREPISPLFGALKQTNEFMEFQIAQEYTGQQKHLCYLVPMWKEALDFDTFANGKDSNVSKIVDGSLFKTKYGGVAAVSNIGGSECWTGHPLAQANLYGYGRLIWNTFLSSDEIAREWVKLTFGAEKDVEQIIVDILLESREVYEKYTCPLGVGWMVNPNHHYGPSVEGYEYSPWGTYNYADYKSIGVDRTVATGTGYIGEYEPTVADKFENLATCPEELLLFFHNVLYSYKLKTGKTVIQHIYDTHFEGVEKVDEFINKWETLQNKIDSKIFDLVMEKFQIQKKDSREWRDVVNTYFYRKTGIDDLYKRKIY